MYSIKPGTLLIADPFLKDPNFLRSVVLICDYKEAGSFGFVLNKKTEYELADLIEGIYKNDIPVYQGGPVEQNTIHFIHQHPDEIKNSMKLTNDTWWGGDFEDAKNLINSNYSSAVQIKFFLGYSGWSEKQLDGEIDEKTWLFVDGKKEIFFSDQPKTIWADALNLMGGKYAQVANYPIDPQLN